MNASVLLRRVVGQLDTLGIPFMLTGSTAAAVHGAARATLNIDLVIDATADQLGALVGSLSSPELYLSPEAAFEALAQETMFNVISLQTGWKADLIIRKSRPFSRTEFARRSPIEFDGCRLWVASLEDVIISKLEWAKLGGSARQLEDVAHLLRVAAGEIEARYLERWIEDLELRDQWHAARLGIQPP